MAKATINNGDSGLTARTAINDNFTELYNICSVVSEVNSSYRSVQIEAAALDNSPIEILNFGAQGFATYDLQTKTHISKVAWSLQMHHNTLWDDVNNKWIQDKAGSAQSVVEVGAEGVTLHCVDTGTDFSNTWHELFQCRIGLEGVSGLPTTGVYNQSKTNLVFIYDAAASYTGDTLSWAGGTANQKPFLWMISNHAFATSEGWIKFDQAGNLTNAGKMLFSKSRGTYGSRSLINAGDSLGEIDFQGHDGTAFHINAQIRVESTTTATTNNVPVKIVFATSATTAASRTDRLSIGPSGSLGLDRTVTAGGTTGDRTINKMAGSVNFAAAATTLTVTNSLVDANSIIIATVLTNDTTAVIKNVVPSSGSFVITLNAAATAETRVGFLVINGV